MKEISAINIPEDIQSLAFRAFSGSGTILQDMLGESMSHVLQVMAKEGLLAKNDSQLIYGAFRKSNPFLANFALQIRERILIQKFPHHTKNEHFKSCQQDLARLTKAKNNLTGYDTRNPEKKQMGGSVKILFQLVFKNGATSLIYFCGTLVGLKEWENLTLFLGTLYLVGFIKFEDQQIQDILARADLAVKNDSSARPKGVTISEYAKMAFDAIDGKKLVKAA